MGVSLEDLLKENSSPLLEDKSKKTINLLLIVIAIIVIAILIVAGLLIQKNNENQQVERAATLATDIDLISAHIKNVYADYRENGDESLLVGRSQEGINVQPITLEVNGFYTEYKYGYYYVTAAEISAMVPTLRIQTEDYVINYSTGDAVNLIGARYNGKIYYDVEDLRAIADRRQPPSDTTINIRTAEDMQYLYQYPNNYFKLQADIDMSYYSTGDGWEPVEEFGGKFDGRGYVIRNLTVSRASDRYCGLFGKINDGAVVNNLKLENVNVSGGEYTGAIAGACSGRVSNCTVTGRVSSQSTNVGGVFGLYENGVAQNIVAQVSVNGSDSVGGFVGSVTSGTLQNCSQVGTVTGSSNVGGFVGRVTPLGSTTLSQVFSDCTVSATEYAGGFMGRLESQNASKLVIKDSYSKGKMTGCNTNAGGFVGYLSAVSTSDVELISLYTVVDTPILCEVRGGFAGNVSVAAGASTSTLNCFWEKDNAQDGALESAGRTNNQLITFEAHSPAEMRVIATFGKWDMEVWKFEKNQTPTLKWQ